MAVDSIVDVNVTLGQWPVRRVLCDDVRRLVAKLCANGVVEAWCGSYDGLFQNDLTAVNDALVKTCEQAVRAEATARHPHPGPLPEGEAVRLRPFGEINPLLSNWEDELERCTSHHQMVGIRLHPNYHGYELNHLDFARLLSAAAERKLVVQLTVLMEDERMMHPLMRVPAVSLAPLAAIVERMSGLRLVLLNALRGKPGAELLQLLSMPGVYCDIAMFEGAAALENLILELPPEKLIFGSHAPSLYFESALLKLRESALPAPHERAITHSNARSLAGEK